jgi:hypothetical protein
MAREENRCMRNQFGIVYKKCCASCALKKYSYDGKRLCSLNNKVIRALHICRKWQMSEGLKNAGRSSGVVRDIVTKEVIF